MTVHQAKELMRICRTKKRRVKLLIYQGGAPIAYITGRLYYEAHRHLWLVDSRDAAASITITDTITIAKRKHIVIELTLTGNRATYARSLAHVPVVDALNAIVKETTNDL